MGNSTRKNNVEIANLIDKHKSLIFKVANTYCTNTSEQEDLIQEIIFHIIKGYEKFDHKVKVTTWMYKVAFNVSISNSRKARIRQKHMVPMPEKLVKIEESDDDEADEKLKVLKLFIDKLAPLNKALLVMYLDGNSYAEISEVMGISPTNVGVKINRIKKQLRKKFKLQ